MQATRKCATTVQLPSGEKVWCPDFNKTINIFAAAGQIVYEVGETYTRPMTAQNTRRTETINVSVGQAFESFNLRGVKKMISHPEMLEIKIV